MKGTVLEGKVKSITKTSVVLETVYGKGDLVIATKDIEAIETDVAFHVYHGDDVDSLGPVVGVTPDQVTVKPEAGEPESIPFADVYVARRDPGPEASFLERLGVELAYWEGNVDLGFSYINATDDSSALATAIGLRRERGPSRLKLEAAYHRSTEKTHGESSNVTVDELYGQVRQEYDVSPRFFAFGSQYAENDGVESLSIRLDLARRIRLQALHERERLDHARRRPRLRLRALLRGRRQPVSPRSAWAPSRTGSCRCWARAGTRDSTGRRR